MNFLVFHLTQRRYFQISAMFLNGARFSFQYITQIQYMAHNQYMNHKYIVHIQYMNHKYTLVT